MGEIKSWGRPTPGHAPGWRLTARPLPLTTSARSPPRAGPWQQGPAGLPADSSPSTGPQLKAPGSGTQAGWGCRGRNPHGGLAGPNLASGDCVEEDLPVEPRVMRSPPHLTVHSRPGSVPKQMCPREASLPPDGGVKPRWHVLTSAGRRDSNPD